MIYQNETSIIGKFQKTHALKGELNAILNISEEFVREQNALIVEMDGLLVPFYAMSIRPKGSTSYLVKLDGINNENEAKVFVNKNIYALKSELAPFLELEEEDMMNEEDLVNYSIVDVSNNKLIGKIESVDSTTDNLLFIVNSEAGDTIYIPAVEEFINEIDDDDKIILMQIPEGLLDLNKTNKKN